MWDLTADPPTLVRAFPESPDNLTWATLSPDGKWMAQVGRGASKVTLYSTTDEQLVRRLVGHEQTVIRAIFSPDGEQLATVSGDNTVRQWDVKGGDEFLILRLPSESPPAPLWDFDFRCTPTGCWIAVPLTRSGGSVASSLRWLG